MSKHGKYSERIGVIAESFQKSGGAGKAVSKIEEFIAAAERK